MTKTQLAVELYRAQIIKIGSFVLKSGQNSAIYLDLRRLVAYPQLLQAVGEALWQIAAPLEFELLCGVPYTALPIATSIAISHLKPMLIRRKEAKNYGTKQLIEGIYQPGQRCLIIEDVVTTGGSIIETLQDLRTAGLTISHALAVIDREQGGQITLANQQCQLHSLFTLRELLTLLQQTDVLTASELTQLKSLEEQLTQC